jgi:hypothetical protein
MGSYSHKRVFRAVSNQLLEKFFEEGGYELEVNWNGSGKCLVKEIFEQFILLPEMKRAILETALHEIHDVASYDDNIVTIRKETSKRNITLPDDFFNWKNYDMVMWIYLNRKDVWDSIVRFAHADRLPKRSWTASIGFPKQRAGFTDDNYDDLKKAITAYFFHKEGRGKYCHIEYFERGNELEYYFVYLNNFTNVSMHWKEEDDFELMPDRRSFEIVFIFNHQDGKLELNFQGDRKVKETLQLIFSKTFFGLNIELNPEDKPAYKIECLKDRSFNLSITPEDEIEEASVQALAISIVGCPGSRREYEEKNGNLYDAMDKEINTDNLPESLRRVEKAKLHFLLEGMGRSNSQTINITRNSCDLKNKPEKVRGILEKCLRSSGLYAV